MTDDLWTRPGFLRDFREGKPAAVTAVYKHYLSRAEAWVRKGLPAGGSGARVPGIKNPADQVEVVQEAFTRALAAEKARLAYDGESDYGLYLMAFVRNVAVDFYRRRWREVLVAGRDSGDPADVLAWAAAPESDEPEHGYLEPRARAIVREYVAGLRDPLRAVHQAIYVDRSFQEDAAKQLNLSRDQVYRFIERLKREVRALLEQAGIRDSNVTLEPEGSAHG